MTDTIRKNMNLPEEVVRLIGDILHSARYRSETQAVISMLEGASDRLNEVDKFVYLIRSEAGSLPRLKIGTSDQPLLEASDADAKLLFCISGDRLSEVAVHMIWGRYRLTGGWFQDRQEIIDWFSRHELLVPLDEIIKTVKPQFPKIKMTSEMILQVEAWCAANVDQVTNEVPTFAQGCRSLIVKGLADLGD